MNIYLKYWYEGCSFFIFYGCILTMGLERHQIDIDHNILMSCISTRLQFRLKIKRRQRVCCQNKISVQLFCAACKGRLDGTESTIEACCTWRKPSQSVCVRNCVNVQRKDTITVLRGTHCLHVCESEEFTWLISSLSLNESIFLFSSINIYTSLKKNKCTWEAKIFEFN